MSKNSFKQAIEELKILVNQDPEFQKNLEILKSIKGIGDLLNKEVITALLSLGTTIVYNVEKLYKEYHLITEEERIEIASEFLDDIIEFKGWFLPLEAIDGFLIKFIISLLVQTLNSKLGHNWFSEG